MLFKPGKTSIYIYVFLFKITLYIYVPLYVVSCYCRFVSNFGVLGILDRLHGTDSMFRASKAYERHFLMLSLTPVSVLYPEEQDKKGCKKAQ